MIESNLTKNEVSAPTVTPNRDKHFARLHAVEDSIDNYTRSMLIVDLEEDDEEDNSEEQLCLLRHIILTTNRQKCIDRMKLLLNPNDGLFDSYTGNYAFMCCISCSEIISKSIPFTGNRAVLAIPREIKKLMRLKSAAGRYDALFALTYMLNYYDAWVSDNEHSGEGGQFDEAILLLGKINEIYFIDLTACITLCRYIIVYHHSLYVT